MTPKLTRKQRLAIISALCAGGKLPCYEDFYKGENKMNKSKISKKEIGIDVASVIESIINNDVKKGKKKMEKKTAVKKTTMKKATKVVSLTSPLSKWALMNKATGKVVLFDTRNDALAKKTDKVVLKKVAITF